MSDFNATREINCPADDLFEYVSNPENMPEYLPTVRHAECQGEDRVRMQGESPGGSYDSDGHYRVNDEEMRMDWGSDGDNAYSGWLHVRDMGGRCLLEVNLRFEAREGQEERFNELAQRKDAIQRGLEQCLESIAMVCEGQGATVDAERNQRGYMG